jgi:hypothetical protein
MVQISTPGRIKKFFSFSKTPRTALGPHILHLSWFLVFFSGLRRPSLEVNHSPPSRPEVKNEWRCASTNPAPTVMEWTRKTLLFYIIGGIMTSCLGDLWGIMHESAAHSLYCKTCF